MSYFRLHGRPRIWSGYGPDRLEVFVTEAQQCLSRAESWVVFDNTAAGEALSDALEFMRLCERSIPRLQRA